jgi:type IV pilus assembly protein PilM
MQLSRSFARWFPVPQLLTPCGTGVDVSDSSVKWLSLTHKNGGTRIASYGSVDVPANAVSTGAVRDPHALADALKEMKRRAKISCAHAALPEEGAFVFSMHVPKGSSRAHVINMIEFELENRVPIPLAQAVYDFDTINARDEHGEEIAVTVFPRELADGYVEAFALAGIDLVSLEIEARSIGRAVSGALDPVTMLVDSGRARTGVAILKRGIPIFTSTIEIGGDQMTHAVMDALKLQNETDAETFKNEHGLIPDEGNRAGSDALDKVAATLAGEITRHYRFWDTRRTADAASVERVYLLGGSANLHGLPEYIAGKVQTETLRPNVWRNAFSFNDYIPPIEYRASFQYATAIGLALRAH